MKRTVSFNDSQDIVEEEEQQKRSPREERYNYFGEDMPRPQNDFYFEDSPRLECERRQRPTFCHVCKAGWHPLYDCKKHRKECMNSSNPDLRVWARINFMLLDAKINRTLVKK